MTKTLFGKILLMALVIILVVSGVSGLFSNYFFTRLIQQNKQQEMLRQAQRVLTNIQHRLEMGGMMGNKMGGNMRSRNMWFMPIRNEIVELEQVLGARIWVMDRDGNVYTQQDTIRQLSEEELKKLYDGKVVTKSNWNDESNEPVMAVALPLRMEKEVLGGLFIVTPMRELYVVQRQIQRIVLWSVLIGSIIAVILAFIFSRRLSKPILAMQKFIGSMRRGDFSGQLEIKREDELGKLAEHFNGLNQELGTTIDLLKKEREQTQRIIYNMAEGVISLNQNNEIVVINPTAKRLISMGKERSLEAFLSEFSSLQTQIDEVKRTNQPLLREIAVDERMLAAIVSPISTGEEEILGVVVVLQDITNRWRLIQLQKDLIANVSHEFKTPLTSIKGFVELLMDQKITDEKKAQGSLQIIYSETRRLIRMVEDLLQMARTESQHLEKKPVDLNDLMQKVVQGLSLKLMEGQVRVQLDSHLDKPVMLDPDKMEQVLYNLLDNGIRFSPPGSVITVRLAKDNSKICIDVKDQGPGIPEKDLEYIFDRFYKVEKARSAQQTGSGLGLAITRNIIEEHGGKIWAKNHPQGGARFIIELPGE